MTAIPNRGEVVLYQPSGGVPALQVRLEAETVWLSQAQLAELFERERSVITKHVGNVFREGELDEKSNVQKMHIAPARRPTVLYSLDVIISVGYRVNSKRGTQFRIWATRTLKEHLVRGHTLNERRLREKGLSEMEQAVALLARTLKQNELVNDEGRAVLDVVQRYARSFVLLRQFDEEQLKDPKHEQPTRAVLDLEHATEAIERLKRELLPRGEATELFGNFRGHGLASILGAIEQTFGGKPLYPSVDSKAAHLLYFVIKDHPFSDGNKRIGSFLFVLFLEQNGRGRRSDGSDYFNDNALVALALLIAESDPAHKQLMIRLVANMLADATDK